MDIKKQSSPASQGGKQVSGSSTKGRQPKASGGNIPVSRASVKGNKQNASPAGKEPAAAHSSYSPHTHEAIVKEVTAKMPGTQETAELSELFKLFGDRSRLGILCALSCSELCVCAIAQLLGMTQSAVSHQLALLRTGKLVTYRREGKTLYYSLADEHVRTIIAMGTEHIEE